MRPPTGLPQPHIDVTVLLSVTEAEGIAGRGLLLTAQILPETAWVLIIRSADHGVGDVFRQYLLSIT